MSKARARGGGHATKEDAVILVVRTKAIEGLDQLAQLGSARRRMVLACPAVRHGEDAAGRLDADVHPIKAQVLPSRVRRVSP